jgi:hypothetical protein
MSGTGVLSWYEGGTCKRYLRGEIPLVLFNVKSTDSSSLTPGGSGLWQPLFDLDSKANAGAAVMSAKQTDKIVLILMVRCLRRVPQPHSACLYISESIQACNNVTCADSGQTFP